MRVLAVDPGPTTGFAFFKNDIFQTWQTRYPPSRAHSDLYNDIHIMLGDIDIIIVEKFEFRKDKERDNINYVAAELVGVVKLYAQRSERIRLVEQSSSLIGKTAFWSDDNQRVKRLRLYDPKASPHGMDALRHLLYFLTFTCKDERWLEKLR